MDRIRELRNLKGVSQARLAVTAGMDPATLNRIEQGKANPTLKTLEKLADALEVKLVELLEEKPKKAQAPLPFSEPEEDAAERRYLIPLLDSYTLIFTEMSKGHKAFLANLSEDLPPRRSLMAYQRVAEFIYACDLIEYTLDEKGVMQAAISLLDRAEVGEVVPDDLLQKAQGFQEAWTELFVTVWTSANNWEESQRSRPEVMEFSEQARKESEDRLAETTGLAYLERHRQRRGKRSANSWGVHVEGAG